jgi:hypothetical protein
MNSQLALRVTRALKAKLIIDEPGAERLLGKSCQAELAGKDQIVLTQVRFASDRARFRSPLVVTGFGQLTRALKASSISQQILNEADLGHLAPAARKCHQPTAAAARCLGSGRCRCW